MWDSQSDKQSEVKVDTELKPYTLLQEKFVEQKDKILDMHWQNDSLILKIIWLEILHTNDNQEINEDLYQSFVVNYLCESKSKLFQRIMSTSQNSASYQKVIQYLLHNCANVRD